MKVGDKVKYIGRGLDELRSQFHELIYADNMYVGIIHNNQSYALSVNEVIKLGDPPVFIEDEIIEQRNVTTYKCDCGSESIGGQTHSIWCTKNK